MNIDLPTAISEFPILQYLSDHFPSVEDSSGDNAYVTCFDCGGKRKLAIDKNYRSAHCFACDPRWGGKGILWDGKAGLPKLISLIEKCSIREAIEKIYKLAGYPDIPQKQRIYAKKEFPQEAIPLSQCLGSEAAHYLTKRNVTQLISQSSVCVRGRYNGRIIIPTRWFDTVTGFEAKAYHSSIKPKSLFPTWLVTSQTLYTTIRWNWDYDFAVITESVLDAETFKYNALGIFGSNLGEGQLLKLLELRKLGVKTLYWAMDQDAWLKQAKLIIQNTMAFFDNYFVLLPEGEDPNSLGTMKCWDLVDKAIKFESELDIAQIMLSYS